MKSGIALGSNLGDRGGLIRRGFEFLRGLSRGGYFLEGPIIETEPVDCPPGSPPFLNSAAEIDYAGTPRELLERLQQFERDLGRPEVRPVNAPRPLDLDILYFGDAVIREADLIVPHPRMMDRGFVLEPLAAIRPDLVLPGFVQTVRERLEELKRTGREALPAKK
jgi:2-amino-4-hydroxy-6-hydroxymethyldihydropteridine diphosphokinase